MLRLRPYKTSDAKTIISWCKDEVAFRKWTSDRYESFPITEADMNQKYVECNGDCCEQDNFYPMTAFDESGIVGHFVMRYTDAEKKVLRLGFVIVDDSKRGKGYGKEALQLALDYVRTFPVGEAKYCWLSYEPGNDVARNLYRSFGFVEEEKLPEGWDEIPAVMEL